ncbi:hypothetical protein BH11PSE10_BH11PSE10_06650 [soil metagenome]
MPALPPDLPPELGRFRLLKSLGEGAQATVWLAHDPRLDREVAVKVLRPGADPLAVDEWLHEARAVSRLNHPNIVPVFEADIHAGGRLSHPYMVFEYVSGGTLAERVRAKGVLAAREAVELSMNVLDALQAAHVAGVVHRDLKPSNILLDPQGRARVMDFGIAARLDQSAHSSKGEQPQHIIGTPGYLSPEGARGEAPGAQMDVFACAVMLAEMLSGKRLNFDRDPWMAVRRVAEQELLLPTGLAPDVDDALRAIVQRGLAPERSQRWASAQAFHDALAGWLHPEHAVAAVQGDGGAALEFLLRRMRHKSDFPAMTDSVRRIQQLTLSDNESISSLSNEILKDVALTHKLLRLVNTVQFSHAGGGSISTVSRAVALVGFAGVRNLALSLVLLERMENKAHAHLLREEFLRSLLAASLARELALTAGENEEAFLCAMFHKLGRSLTEFYFPEEAQQIRHITRPERPAQMQGKAAGAPVSELNASAQVLGMSYEHLGLGVARQWGLPDILQQSMRRPEGEPPARPITQPAERQRWLARAANEVADIILQTEPAEAHAKVRAMAQRYSRALGVTAEAFDKAADQARQRLGQMAQAMDVSIPKNSPAQRLLAPLTAGPNDSLAGLQLQATAVLEPVAAVSAQQRTREQAVEMLAAGIQDITNAMVENFQLNQVLKMILETIYRGLNFRRVVFCLRDPKTETLTGRFGLGDGIESVVPLFRVPLRSAPGSQPDLFAAVCQKGVDTLIADASIPKIADRLPTWFLGKPKARTFLLLPMAMKGTPFALIYADKVSTDGVDLGDKELALLRTLRNQAVMAFKQVG